MEMLLKLDGKCSISIKKDFLAFYDQYLKYLEKWFDFFDSYYPYEIKYLLLKSKPTYSDCKETVVVLNLTSINLDESYEEFYVRYTIALLLNEKSKETLYVSDKWCQVILAADS
jgi:hypothetical protein